MLSEPIDLSTVDATQIINHLYEFFHRDFISTDTYLAGEIYINPQCDRKTDGKEDTFWHLTTRKEKEFEWVNGRRQVRVLERYPDFRRASRLEWVRQIITNHQDASIKLFYHQETNSKKNIRLYLWAEDEDFVVILQKLGKSSSFLVTSFYVDHQRKKDDYQKRYNNYITNENGLRDYSWF